MPHDPELVAETQAWFVKASQAFKGFLTWHSTPFRKTHNLDELGE